MAGMNQRWFPGLIVSVLLGGGVAAAQEAQVVVHADQVSHRVSRYLTGACIEDVNHEIYGGIYSQMIFGESFQEPPLALPLEGFTTYGGRWVAKDGAVRAEGGDGPKLISDEPAFEPARWVWRCFCQERKGGNAGLIVKVNDRVWVRTSSRGTRSRSIRRGIWSWGVTGRIGSRFATSLARCQPTGGSG
jgi:hypothetical protein